MFTTSACKPRVVSASDDRFGFTVECAAGDKVLGTLHLVRTRTAAGQTAMGVSSIEVVRGNRRQGIGTALYEAAAKHACEAYGVPLASGRERSAAADKFWRKQEKKGRAICTADSGGKKRPCVEYALACPAPVSLAGARKRKRRPRNTS